MYFKVISGVLGRLVNSKITFLLRWPLLSEYISVPSEYAFYDCFTVLSNVRTIQKQPSRGVLSKRCSENMQQIYRRTPMPKCDFNKFAKQLY